MPLVLSARMALCACCPCLQGQHCVPIVPVCKDSTVCLLSLSARTALCACCACLQGQHCVPIVPVCKDSTVCLLSLSARTALCAYCPCLQGQHCVPIVPVCKDNTVCLPLKVVQHWAAQASVCLEPTSPSRIHPEQGQNHCSLQKAKFEL